MLMGARMQHEGISYSWSENDCEEEFTQLFSACFNTPARHGILLEKSYGWREKKQYLLATARDQEGQLVGAAAFYPRRFSCGKSSFLGLECCDVMVLKACRGRSIFSRLIDFSLKDIQSDGYDFLLGFPNPEALPGWIKAGVGPIYSSNSYFVPLAIGSFLIKKLRMPNFFKYPIDQMTIALNRIRRNRTADDSILHISPLNQTSIVGLTREDKDLSFNSMSPSERFSRYEFGKNLGLTDMNYFVASVSKKRKPIFDAIVGVRNKKSAHIYEIFYTDRSEIISGLSCIRLNVHSKFKAGMGLDLEQLCFEVPVAPQAILDSILKSGFIRKKSQAKVFVNTFTSRAQKSLIENAKLVCQLADSDAP